MHECGGTFAKLGGGGESISNSVFIDMRRLRAHVKFCKSLKVNGPFDPLDFFALDYTLYTLERLRLNIPETCQGS